MHQLVSTDDRIDRAGFATVRTADTQRFVDDRDRGINARGKRNDLPSEKVRQSSHGFFTARWTEVDRCGAIDDGRRKRATARITALRTLSLRQQFIDLFNEVFIVGR